MLQKQGVTPLCNNWEYKADFKEEYIYEFNDTLSVSLPHTTIELPYNNIPENTTNFISSYQTIFSLQPKKTKRYVLVFDGVMEEATVYVNQIQVVIHKGGYTPFEIDVTEVVHNKDNTLFVKVDSTERQNIPPHGFVVDYMTYGGIYREVYLEEREKNHINHALIDVIDNTIKLRLTLRVEEKTSGLFDICIYDDDTVIHKFKKERTLKKQINIKEELVLEPWSIENPKLYRIEIRLNDVVMVHTRFAKRSVQFKNDGFYLNGNKLFLRGLNRHQAYPYVGYAMPKRMQYHDADVLKYDLGCNIVRSSHYPPSKHFLDRCDEIGLLVFTEIPGWQHIGDESWKSVSYNDLRQMLYRDYNHPSIIIWGVRINESNDDDSFYEKTNMIAKEIDPYRPTGGVRNFAGSNLLEDVYTFNDFTHRGKNDAIASPKKVMKQRAPYLITEYNGHMFPTKPWDDERHRVEHALRHMRVLSAATADETVSGAIGWCMADYNTHKEFGSGDKVCYHGVLDMFRNPKFAASTYRSQSNHEPYMEVLSNFHIGEYPASELQQVVIHTNVDYVKLYMNDEYISTIYPAKDEFRGVSHPPMIITDFIGQRIHENEEYSEKDCDRIKSVLQAVMKYGMKLPLRIKIKLLIFLWKHKMKISDAAIFYEKYVGGWGTKSLQYTIKGYIEDQCVITKVKQADKQPVLRVLPDRTTLQVEETYDVTRVVIRLEDEFENILEYATDAFHLEVAGNIALIGPNNLSLHAGQIACYVKTIDHEGTGILRVTSSRFSTKTVHFKISQEKGE